MVWEHQYQYQTQRRQEIFCDLFKILPPTQLLCLLVLGWLHGLCVAAQTNIRIDLNLIVTCGSNQFQIPEIPENSSHLSSSPNQLNFKSTSRGFLHIFNGFLSSQCLCLRSSLTLSETQNKPI